MSGLDLATSAGVLRFCELRRAEMVRCFERLGRFEANGYSVGGYALITHDVTLPPADKRAEPTAWRTGRRLPGVAPVHVQLPHAAREFLPPAQLSEVFGSAVRRYCKLGRAVGAIVMGEMWLATSASLEERDKLPDRLDDYAGRREVLYMRLEHRAVGGRVWTAEIGREPTRLAAWREGNPATLGGHLVNVIERQVWAS